MPSLVSIAVVELAEFSAGSTPRESVSPNPRISSPNAAIAQAPRVLIDPASGVKADQCSRGVGQYLIHGFYLNTRSENCFT